MITSKQIADLTHPLHRASAQLSQAAGDVERGRPISLDPAATAGQVDAVLAGFLRDQRSRALWLKTLAVRASRCEAIVQRVVSGDTSYNAGDAVAELASLAAAVRDLDRLVRTADQDREAA